MRALGAYDAGGDWHLARLAGIRPSLRLGKSLWASYMPRVPDIPPLVHKTLEDAKPATELERYSSRGIPGTRMGRILSLSLMVRILVLVRWRWDGSIKGSGRSL